MSPVLRKRKASTVSAPFAEIGSEESEISDSEVEDKDYIDAPARKYNCPLPECETTWKKPSDCRIHFRSRHTQVRPFSCAFPSCNHRPFSVKSKAISHIFEAHFLASKCQAPKYLKVDQTALDEEAKLLCPLILGNEEYKRGDDNEESTEDTLPHFDAIYQNPATGYLICPVRGCNQNVKRLKDLKNHYLLHLNSKWQTYRCVFNTALCQFSSNKRSNIKRHICAVHAPRFSPDDDQINSFIHQNTDVLKKVDALFNCALKNFPKMIGRSAICPFANCRKLYSSVGGAFSHYLSHTNAKPYRCSKCNLTFGRESLIQGHILALHFNVPHSLQGSVGSALKAEAKQYVEVLNDVLQQEKDAFTKGLHNMPEHFPSSEIDDKATDWDDDPYEDEEKAEDDRTKLSTGKKPTLFAVEAIPAGRLVALVARIVGVELDVKPIDLYAKEQLKPEFIKVW